MDDEEYSFEDIGIDPASLNYDLDLSNIGLDSTLGGNFAGDMGFTGLDEDFYRQIGIDPASLSTDFGSSFSNMSNDELQAAIMGQDYFDPETGYNKTLMDELSQYNQNFEITPENQASFDQTMQEVMDNGGLTSGWQTSGSDRIMVRDDGSAIGINTETGETYALTPAQTSTMIKSGTLNSRGSGYFDSTGGSNAAPGGGTPVTLRNGATGVLTTSGRVIDPATGAVIGGSSDVRGGTGTTSGNANTGDGSGAGTTVPDWVKKLLSGGPAGAPVSGMGSILPLLLMMLAMNRGGGGGGGSNATIPALTATQKQTPYAATQRAPGYRPGQGGITYFNPTQYTPRMAAGGIAELSRGRLLNGPGDGVSDSIPAQIGSDQPARLARGEYVIDARTVAALGNGSTDAGAERLDEMRKRILADDRKAGVGKDSKAYRHLKV